MDIQDLIRENVKNLKPYSTARHDFSGAAKIYLDANESPFNNGLNRYPDPLQQTLKVKISQVKGLEPDCMVIGNGSDEILDLFIRAFCEPGQDNIILVTPSYGMYKVLAGINRVETREVLLQEDFSLPAEEILKRSDRNSKILFLCSPNNPSGNAFDKKAVEYLLQEFKGLVVMDEAYIDFAPGKSLLSELKKYPNLVVTQTFSKAWGLAGIRMGISFSSPEIAGILNRIKYPYNVNTLTQKRVMKVLSFPEKIENNVRLILREKSILQKELKQFPSVIKIFPSDANFFLV